MLDALCPVAVKAHPQPDSLSYPGCYGYRAGWLVAVTHSQAERWAERNLRRLGYATYLPLIVARRRDPVLRSQWRLVETPLFPGYLFVRHDSRDPRRPIRETPGVRDLVRCGADAQYVPEADIAALQDTEADRRAPPASTLRVGSAVRIPTLHADGVVLDLAGSKARVSAMMLGALRTITVPVAHLETRE